MVHLRINERIGWCAPHGFEACDLERGRGGILSEKRRRRAAQAPGGTGGGSPISRDLSQNGYPLSLSLSLSDLLEFGACCGRASTRIFSQSRSLLLCTREKALEPKFSLLLSPVSHLEHSHGMKKSLWCERRQRKSISCVAGLGVLLDFCLDKIGVRRGALLPVALLLHSSCGCSCERVFGTRSGA